MKISKIILVGFLSLTLNAYAKTDSETHLLKYIDKITSYQCRFVQSIDDPDGNAVSKMNGELSVLRPGRFMWKTNPPDPIVVVADGKTLWTYDIELEQVTQQDLKKALASSPAAILIGSADQIMADFNVTEIHTGACESKQQDCFILEPKHSEENFGQIKLIFRDDKLVEVSMDDPLGQHVLTKFTDINVNIALNNQLFNFVPPADVDVIKPGS
tara:strand:+ start:21837 stop:22478 length:642 start_codon:yes stop_codon:yes gene_type:complete